MRVERRYLNKKLREATENEWWTKYLKRASEQELLDFSGASNMEEFNSDICSSCEDLPGYNAKHIDWLIPKDEYFDALADDGYDIIELCEMDGKQFLGYMVGGRLYDIGDEVKECCGQSVGPNESLNESSKKDFKDKYLNLKRKIEDEASKNNSMVFFSDGEDILPAFRVKSRDKFYSTCMWNALYNMIGTEDGLRRYSDTEFGYEERLSKFRSLLSGNTYKKRAYSGNMVKSNSSTGIVGITRLSDGSVRPNIKFKGIKFTGKRTFDEEKAKSIRKSMEEIVNHGGLSDEEKIDKLREVIKESLNESNNVIDFLKKIKFGDEFDFEEVGDWGISAWTSRPLLNFSNGFYIVQLDNDKLNKHFVIPDNETEDEFIRNRDSFIKRHFNDLNESVKGMQRANRKTGFLNEASYGGAFDIEDDQFFTRDDINEFGYDIADQFSAWADSTFDLSDVYMDTPTKLHLEVLNSEDYEEYGADIKIDMRRIRSPKDLYRYEDEVLRQLKDAYFEYHAEDEMEI